MLRNLRARDSLRPVLDLSLVCDIVFKSLEIKCPFHIVVTEPALAFLWCATFVSAAHTSSRSTEAMRDLSPLDAPRADITSEQDGSIGQEKSKWPILQVGSGTFANLRATDLQRGWQKGEGVHSLTRVY